jgi:hypothetical protein
MGHAFWDPVVCGTVSASPQLLALYGLGEPPYSDSMGYLIARQYIRNHHLVDLPIVNLVDGQVQIDVLKGMGVYDEIMRRVFFEMVTKHPWLVLKSFVYDKPRDQLEILSHMKIIWPIVFCWSLVLAIGAGALTWMLGERAVRTKEVIAAVRAMPLVGLFSLSTTFVMPSLMIADTVMIFLMFLLIVAAFAPLVLAGLLRDKRSTARAPASVA